ncbi:DoxX family protein [Veillonella caviae]|uniref:DoxX family protein n=1 Tax=Veillonella caviae TaxID=248316 RepID=UPI000F8D72D6|nr:DoxX family protein [Veillonella caviae]MCF0157268.1 DoxX family protein [Veillonella sp.]MCI5708110.1 DoxX family protein [Veillonella caviae]MCI7693182.1 DoxX family protein [Veillonella caviae]MDD7291675.1 DoxX family protein [Veillonella caviae]MDY4746832.1 DoxX family protein [Veillonella caviae]
MLSFLFKGKPNYINFGLLFYRIALGASMFYHGYLKWLSGSEGLYKVGAMLAPLGVSGGYELLGTAAAIAEMLGGILIILGLFTRIGALLLVGTLAVATILHINGNFFGWDYPSQMAFGAIMLFFAGAGRYSFDAFIFKK